MEADKGVFLNWYRQNYHHSHALFIVLGDDKTDEDMFGALNKNDISIKVGVENTKANYRLHHQREVIDFLAWLDETIP